jgi:hypothetical protein
MKLIEPGTMVKCTCDICVRDGHKYRFVFLCWSCTGAEAVALDYQLNIEWLLARDVRKLNEEA